MATSGAELASIIWRSRWDLLEQELARPENEEVIVVAYTAVDKVLDLTDSQKTKSKVGAIIRKASNELQKEYYDLVPEDWRQKNVDDLFKDLITRIFKDVYWSIQDSGLSEDEGACSLALCISAQTVKTLLKLNQVEGYQSLVNEFVDKLQIPETAGRRGREEVRKNRSDDDNIETRIDVNNLPLVDGAPWSLDSKPNAGKMKVTYDCVKRRILTACESYGLSGKKACFYAIKNFEGTERTFAQSALAGVPQGSEDSLAMFFEKMDGKYLNYWSEGRALSEFTKLKKNANEDPITYLNRLSEIAKTLPVSDGELRKQFLQGLSPGLMGKLRASYGPRLYSKSLEKIADSASYYEAEYLAERGDRPQIPLGRPGEFRQGKGFPRPGPQVSSSPLKSQTSSASAGESKSLTWSGGAPRCYSCQQLGHLQRECPLRKTARDPKDGESKDRTKGSAAEAKQGIVTVQIGANAAEAEEKHYGQALTSSTLYSVGRSDTVPEIVCDIGQSGTYDQKVLLDTGAGCSLIGAEYANQLIKEGRALVLRTPQVVRLTFANGDVEESVYEVIVPIGIKKDDKKVTYHLPFVVSRTARMGLLLGRHALCLIGVKLSFGGIDQKELQHLKQIYEENINTKNDVVDSHTLSSTADEENTQQNVIYVHISQVTDEPIVVDEETLLEDGLGWSANGGIESREWLEKTIEQALPSLDTSVETDNDEVNLKGIEADAKICLDEQVKKGWVPISRGFRGRLAPKSEILTADTPNQQYQFQVSWDVEDADIHHGQKRRPWDSTRLIDDLSPSEKEEWDRQINGYVSRGWWVHEPDGPPADERHLAATCFPVRQCELKSTRIRPCVDLRRANDLAPRLKAAAATGVGPTSISDAILRLRGSLHSGRRYRIDQYDLEKAFYSIRVLPRSATDGRVLKIWIRCGSIWFSSSCLVFGTSAGPLSLNYSQLTLLTIMRHILSSTPISSVWIPVMDDFVVITEIKAESHKVTRTTEICMEILWELTGFRCPPSKRASWSSTTEQRWLGAHWTYDAETGQLAMRRPSCEAIINKMSKREVYRAAGKFLLFTFGAAESASRAHADAMRRIAGKWPDWDTVCTDTEQCAQIQSHLECGKQHWADCYVEDQNLSLLGSVTKVVVEVDGSQEGHGFIAIDASDLSDDEDRSQLTKINSRVIIAEAKAFSEKHLGWHANRRELTAIAFAMKRIDDIRLALPSLVVVIIRTDSRVATGQTDPWSRVATKSVERKALLRLRGVVVETAFDWQLHGVKTRVQHISGKSNVTADKLSRTVSEKRYHEPILSGRDVPSVVANVNLLTSSTVSSNDSSGGLTGLVLPSFVRFLDLHSIFQAWRGANQQSAADITEDPEDLRKRWLRLVQSEDEETSQALEQLKKTVGNGDAPTLVNGYLYNLFIDEDGILKRRTLRGSLTARTGQKDEHIQTVLPRSLMAEVAVATHAELGHAGFLSTFREVSQSCWSPKCREIVKSSVSNCIPCIRTVPKASNVLKAFPGPVILPRWPFEIVGADLYGPIRLRTSRRSKDDDDGENGKGPYILTITDRLTGYCLFELIPNSRSDTVVRAFEKVICWELCAKVRECWTDRGSQFMSSTWGSMCLLSSIKHRVNLPATPHLGGWWETYHKPLTKCIRSLLDGCSVKNLQEMVSIAQARINSSCGTDSRPSAHELLYGWEPCLPISKLLSTEKQINDDYDATRPTILPEDPIHRERAVQEALSRSRHRKNLLALFNEAWLQSRAERYTYLLKKAAHSGTLSIGDRVVWLQQRHNKFGRIVRDDRIFIVVRSVGNQCYKIKPLDDSSKSTTIGGSPMWPIVHRRNLYKISTNDLTATPTTDDVHQGEDIDDRSPDLSDSPVIDDPLNTIHYQKNPNPSTEAVQKTSDKSLDNLPPLEEEEQEEKGTKEDYDATTSSAAKGSSISPSRTSVLTKRSRKGESRELRFLSSINRSVSRYGRSRKGGVMV